MTYSILDDPALRCATCHADPIRRPARECRVCESIQCRDCPCSCPNGGTR